MVLIKVRLGGIPARQPAQAEHLLAGNASSIPASNALRSNAGWADAGGEPPLEAHLPTKFELAHHSLCLQKESNLHRPLRRRLLYPLSYGGLPYIIAYFLFFSFIEGKISK